MITTLLLIRMKRTMRVIGRERNRQRKAKRETKGRQNDEESLSINNIIVKRI